MNAYTPRFAVLLVTGGRLGDIFGAAACSWSASSSSALSSAFIGLSQSDAWLVAGRAAQGIGAAFMMPATLSIITNAFPPQERGKAIGTWAGVSALALAIGRWSAASSSRTSPGSRSSSSTSRSRSWPSP